MVYTHAIWVVKDGRERDFVAGWQDLATRTIEAFPEAHGTLLRDPSNPRRFISFGPWSSAERAAQWREAMSSQFAVLRELLESFEPGVYEHVSDAHN